MSTHLSVVAFYEATFHVGLRLPIHPTIRRILNFYNICPVQLSSNAWQSVIYVFVVWWYYKDALSLNEFRCPYSLFKNPKPNSRWLYFKVRSGRTVVKGSPSNSRGGRGGSSSSQGWLGIFFKQISGGRSSSDPEIMEHPKSVSILDFHFIIQV